MGRRLPWLGKRLGPSLGGAQGRTSAPSNGGAGGGRGTGDGASATVCAETRAPHGNACKFIRETTAQSTLEYAITTFAVLALIVGIAALWRAGEDGVFVGLVEDAASHAFTDLGALDISLY